MSARSGTATVGKVLPGNGAVVVSAVRSAVTRSHRGAFRDTRPDDLCAAVVREALARLPDLDPDQVEDVVVGCSNPEGEQGLTLGRQVALLAGLPVSVAGLTVSRACASGAQAVCLAAWEVEQGFAEVAVAAGVESMTRVPPAGFSPAPNPRISGEPLSAYSPMGLTAERLAERCKIRRDEQDGFALESHRRAVRAQEAGRFQEQILPIRARIGPTEPGEPPGGEEWAELVVEKDEGPRPDTSPEALARLRPAFKEDGTVTAGNSSPLSDGAAAVVVMSARKAMQSGIEILAAVRTFAVAGVAPDAMGLGPVFAIRKLLSRTGFEVADIDLWEINEAFAVQVLACASKLGLPHDRLNVNGGAIALGHPLGASGCRILVDLLAEMKRRGAVRAVESLCVGGGQGFAMLVESPVDMSSLRILR